MAMTSPFHGQMLAITENDGRDKPSRNELKIKVLEDMAMTSPFHGQMISDNDR